MNRMSDGMSREKQAMNESEIIFETAAMRHDMTCGKGDRCAHRSWHIHNDYMRKAQADRITELEAQIAEARAVSTSVPRGV